MRPVLDQKVLRLSEPVDHRIGAALHALRDVQKAFKDQSHWVVLYLKTCEQFLEEATAINDWRHDQGCRVRVLVDIPAVTPDHQAVAAGQEGWITGYADDARLFQFQRERPEEGWPKYPVQLLSDHYEVLERPENPVEAFERKDCERNDALFAGASQ